MKLTGIDVLELEAPVSAPWRIATARLATMGAIVVGVHTDEGVTGPGECILE